MSKGRKHGVFAVSGDVMVLPSENHEKKRENNKNLPNYITRDSQRTATPFHDNLAVKRRIEVMYFNNKIYLCEGCLCPHTRLKPSLITK